MLLMERSYFLSLDAEQLLMWTFSSKYTAHQGLHSSELKLAALLDTGGMTKIFLLCGVRWSHSHNVMALLKLNES